MTHRLCEMWLYSLTGSPVDDFEFSTEQLLPVSMKFLDSILFRFCFDFTYVVRAFLPMVLLLGFVTNCLVVFPRFCLFIGKGYVNNTLLFVSFWGVLF